MNKVTTALLLLIAWPAHAQVTVEAPWARASAPRQEVGAAYLKLRSAMDDRLVSVSTPVATAGQTHEMTMEGGVMRMRELPGIALPAGRTVSLEPGGLHLMLMGLRAPLRVGDTFPLHLTFEHAAPMDVTVTVRSAGGQEMHH